VSKFVSAAVHRLSNVRSTSDDPEYFGSAGIVRRGGVVLKSKSDWVENGAEGGVAGLSMISISSSYHLSSNFGESRRTLRRGLCVEMVDEEDALSALVQ
jgi:hypothetical protein